MQTILVHGFDVARDLGKVRAIGSHVVVDSKAFPTKSAKSLWKQLNQLRGNGELGGDSGWVSASVGGCSAPCNAHPCPWTWIH